MNQYRQWGVSLLLIAMLSLLPFNQLVAATSGEELTEQQIEELKAKINEKRQQIDELTSQRKIYEDTIKAKQNEAASLSSEVSVLESQIKKSEVDIDITQNEIEALQLEIEDVNSRIAEKETDIAGQKDRMRGLIRQLYERGSSTTLEVTLLYDSFSDYFDQIEYLEQTQQELKGSLDHLSTLRDDLQKISSTLDKKQSAYETTRDRLNSQKDDLVSQRLYKDNLLEDTKDNEQLFQSLLGDVQREQEATNAEINNLIAQANGDVALTDPGVLSWPVSPGRGITTYFHDPAYIFKKYIGNHSGLDIRASQGTPIGSAADGIVLRAKDGGLGLSFILIRHDDEIVTAYLHTSKILVQEGQFVTRGQTIGLVGGIPGTPGAGGFSTGAHLHFEVRVNGIPVDPLEYLP